jgi:ATP-dependent RNA helicase DeaD
MLKMGFIEDVDFILSCLIHEHQTLLFAATMPDEINRLIGTYLKDPVRVELNKAQISPQSLVHHFRHVGWSDRLTALTEYLEEETVSQAIVFCNSRHHGDKLLKDLRKKFDSLEYIHGGLEQPKRTSIFDRFRRNEITLLVATDVAGRGLDFSHVSHVINYDYPMDQETYTHRTGRTGRMGRSGTAMTFVTDRELITLKTLFKNNRIHPVWHGSVPDLQNLSKRKGRGNGQHSFTRRPGKAASHETQTVQRSYFMKGNTHGRNN